jgi:hypothetical protein
MDSSVIWVLRGLNEAQGTLRLSHVSDLIDWTPFRLILEAMYTNKTERRSWQEPCQDKPLAIRFADGRTDD